MEWCHHTLKIGHSSHLERPWKTLKTIKSPCDDILLFGTFGGKRISSSREVPGFSGNLDFGVFSVRERLLRSNNIVKQHGMNLICATQRAPKKDSVFIKESWTKLPTSLACYDGATILTKEYSHPLLMGLLLKKKSHRKKKSQIFEMKFHFRGFWRQLRILEKNCEASSTPFSVTCLFFNHIFKISVTFFLQWL